MGDDAAARTAGLAVIEPGIYLTAPTRRHRVLVQWDDGRWLVWAGAYAEGSFAAGGNGVRLVRDWELYRGRSLGRALQAATRFARRVKR